MHLHNCFSFSHQNNFRCNVSLRGNGLKVLTANSYIPSDTAVIECRGKYMLNNPGLNKVKIMMGSLFCSLIIFWFRRAEAIPMCCSTGWALTWRFLWTGQLMEMTAGSVGEPVRARARVTPLSDTTLRRAVCTFILWPRGISRRIPRSSYLL